MQYQRRQTQAQQECFVGNGQLSCYPVEGSTFTQDVYGRFIWNRDYPDFTNSGGNVDIYLFQEDSDELVFTWTSIENAQGRISFLPQDLWWQDREQAQNFNGTNITWPYYFIITHAGKGLGGGPLRQPTWFAIQTALPVAVAASRSSAAQAGATSVSANVLSASVNPTPTPIPNEQSMFASTLSASLTSALASSLRAENATGTQTLHGTATGTIPNGGGVVTISAVVQANGQLVNDQGGGSGLPRYAIALIIIFGLLSLLTLIAGIYFCLRATRRRSPRGNRVSYDTSSQTGSNTPMMNECGDRATVDVGQIAPVLVHRSGNAGAALEPRDMDFRAPTEELGLTSSEVWRIANAFRSVLRRPQFTSLSRRQSLVESAGSPKNVESPRVNETLDHFQSSTIDEAEEGAAAALLREELECEGHQLRSVEERKTPTIHQ